MIRRHLITAVQIVLHFQKDFQFVSRFAGKGVRKGGLVGDPFSYRLGFNREGALPLLLWGKRKDIRVYLLSIAQSRPFGRSGKHQIGFLFRIDLRRNPIGIQTQRPVKIQRSLTRGCLLYTSADQYLFFCDAVERMGFVQYEISNFTHPGFESRHNLNYWNCGTYLGLGPGAHSFFQGRRRFYSRDLADYLSHSHSLWMPQEDGPGGDLEEYLDVYKRQINSCWAKGGAVRRASVWLVSCKNSRPIVN